MKKFCNLYFYLDYEMANQKRQQLRRGSWLLHLVFFVVTNQKTKITASFVEGSCSSRCFTGFRAIRDEGICSEVRLQWRLHSIKKYPT